MAEPMFKGKAGGALKRVPKWAWYVSAGIGVAGMVYYARSRQVVTEPSGDMAEDEGAVGYTDGQYAPGIIVPPVIGGEAVPAEINTDIPLGTMEIFGGLFSDLIGLLGQQTDSQADLLDIIANGGAGGQNPDNSAGGTVTVASPAAAPAAPKPNPATRLEPGYHAGATVNMGPNARKNFPGAVGWVRIEDGGKGADHWIDVHVRHCDRLERWRVRPNAKGSPWQKIWQGPRPNICV